MDSLTYELRINLEQLRRSDVSVSDLRTVGGGANSPLWLQIKADITGCVVRTLKVREAACLGAALLGFCGTGFYTQDEAVQQAVHTDKSYTPDPAAMVQYEEKYVVYKQIYDSLKAVNKLL
jgi:xylulokinase